MDHGLSGPLILQPWKLFSLDMQYFIKCQAISQDFIKIRSKDTNPIKSIQISKSKSQTSGSKDLIVIAFHRFVQANGPPLCRQRGPPGGRPRADSAPGGRGAAHGARPAAHRGGAGGLRGADPGGSLPPHQGENMRVESMAKQNFSIQISRETDRRNMKKPHVQNLEWMFYFEFEALP